MLLASHDHLEIRIFAPDEAGGTCQVVAVGPEDRRAQGRFQMPFTTDDANAAIDLLDTGHLDAAEARRIGAELFRALVTPDIRPLYDALDTHGARPAIHLIVDDPRVAGLPWELLFDPRTRAPVVLQRVLVRGVAIREAAPARRAEPPVRILVIAAAPTDTEPLESRLEVNDISDALASRRAVRSVVVESLTPPTVERLVDALRESEAQNRPIHVLHWIGHGGRDPSTGSVSVLFESEEGLADPIDGPRMAAILSGSGVQLVYLNACHSAAALRARPDERTATGVTTGLADALLASGVPAVIGMQTSVLDHRAARFARDFYRALADGAPVGEAVLDARRLVRDDRLGPGADLGIPVCYLRSPDMTLVRPPAAAGIRGRAEEAIHALPRPLRWIAATAGASLVGAVSLALAATLWGAIQGPRTLSGEMNVVVTEFGAVGPNGEEMQSDRARDLSRHLATSLGSELDELQDDLHVDFLGPDEAGRLRGATAEARTTAAEALAARVGADIVIYGVLADTGRSLTPEFYINPSFLEGAEELVGSSRLGSAIASVGGNPHPDIELRQRLGSRAKSLALFVAGLVYLAAGNHETAEARFDAALSDGSWPEADGKEVMYLFRGTAAALDGRMDDAEASYNEALRLNPDYARAFLGLAGVALVEGHQGCTPTTADEGRLRESWTLYAAAMEAGDRPPRSAVAAKAHLGIARSMICLSQAGFENRWSEAAAELRAVLDEHEAGGYGTRELAAEAHGELGLIRLPAIGDNDPDPKFTAAADEYRAAAALTERPDRKAFFLGQLGWILKELGNRQGALEAYDEAAEAAGTAGDATSRDRYLRLRRDLTAPAAPSSAFVSRRAM